MLCPPGYGRYSCAIPLRRQLLIKRGSALLESKIVALPAVEVNRSCLERSLVLAGKGEGIVRPPMRHVDRISDERRERVPSILRAFLSQLVQLLRRLKNQGGTLRADGRE